MILGGPGPSKNREKIEKIDFLTRSFLKEGSGSVLERFSGDFELIFNGFCDDFLRNLERETMIRATMGISMDGWMDGWMDRWLDWMDGRMDG